MQFFREGVLTNTKFVKMEFKDSSFLYKQIFEIVGMRELLKVHGHAYYFKNCIDFKNFCTKVNFSFNSLFS